LKDFSPFFSLLKFDYKKTRERIVTISDGIIIIFEIIEKKVSPTKSRKKREKVRQQQQQQQQQQQKSEVFFHCATRPFFRPLHAKKGLIF